jgi:hypothetical protein
MKGFKDSNNKFHPITQSKGVRKSRDQKTKVQGIRIKLPNKIVRGRLKEESFGQTLNDIKNLYEEEKEDGNIPKNMSFKHFKRKYIQMMREQAKDELKDMTDKEILENFGVRKKRKLVLMRNPQSQNDKNHILSSVLGSNSQFKKEAGETEAELWFTAQVQLKRRGWEGKVNRKEFDKWLALERQKRYKRVAGEEFAQFFRDQKSEEITNEVKNKWENVIVKESMHKLSKGFTLQVLDQLTNNFQLEMENVDYDFIKKEKGFIGVEKELQEIKKRDLESALFFLEQKFGYGEADRRPENRGQEIAQALLEPFERMKDEELAKIKNRESDFVKSKKIIKDVTDDLFADAKESLREGL